MSAVSNHDRELLAVEVAVDGKVSVACFASMFDRVTERLAGGKPNVRNGSLGESALGGKVSNRSTCQRHVFDVASVNGVVSLLQGRFVICVHIATFPVLASC